MKNKVGQNVVMKNEDKNFSFESVFQKTLFHLLLIIFVGLASYSNTFTVPFQFDDFSQIVDNPVITSKNLINLSSSAGGVAYNARRYIGYLTFALNYRFGGFSVTGYHIVNLAIHLANAILLYFLVLITFKTPYFNKVDREQIADLRKHGSQPEVHNSQIIALFSALLFVAHPVQTQAVTYIVQRFTSLASMFYLFSVVMFVKGRLGQSTNRQQAVGKRFTIIWYLLSLLSAILAMMTKEIAFTLPVMIIVYEFTFFQSSLRKKLVILVIFLAALVIFALGMTNLNKPLGAVLHDVDIMTRVQTHMPRLDYLFTQMRVIVTYVRLLFMPLNQQVDYSYTIYRTFLTPPVLLSFVFLASLFGTAIYLLYKSRMRGDKAGVENGNPEEVAETFSPSSAHFFRLSAFGILWFFITLSVESSVIPIIDLIYEHRVYLPSAGLFIAIVSVASLASIKMEDKWPRAKRTVIALGFIVVAALSLTTFARNRVWRDDLSLWEDQVSKAPENVRAHDLLGNAYTSRGFFEKAIREYKAAVQLDPEFDMGYYNLGNAYAAGGFHDKAIESFDKAIALNPLHYQTYANRGISFVSMGRFDNAIKDFSRSISLHPSHLVYYWRAVAFQKSGQNEKAIDDYKQSIALDPSFIEAYMRLGVLYGSSGAFDKAIDQFNRVVAINPVYSAAFGNRGFAYSLMGRYEEALRDFGRAIELAPSNGGTYVNRGKIYLKIGEGERAATDFSKACDLGEQEGCMALKRALGGKGDNTSEPRE